MSLAKKTLSPEVEARVQQVLNQTAWEKEYPKVPDRLTAYRTAKEQITARVLADLATEQARRDAAQAREAAAEQARYGQGGRYGH